MAENKNIQPLFSKYITRVQRQLLEAYLEPRHFAEALKLVEEYLSAETAFLWLDKKSRGMQRWYLCSSGHPFLADMDMKVKYPDIYDQIQADGGGTLYTADMLARIFPESGRQLVEQGIESLMLYPVYNARGRLEFTLGTVNHMKNGEDPEPLAQVALSFLLAVNHYDNYHVLSRIGKIDMMTGLLNRNSYQMALANLAKDRPQSIACVYIDVNGLHEVNNYLGHQAGDEMLRSVANAILRHFGSEEAFRIGGDECVLLCRDWQKHTVDAEIQNMQDELLKSGYGISVGIHWEDGEYLVDDVVNEAENRMRAEKQRFYEKDGKARNLNQINEQLEKMLTEKRDADIFLSVLEPEFKGVYFVDLNSDSVRHIFIPKYFEELLVEAEEVFSDAMLEYARRYVKEEYIGKFRSVCDYIWLREQLDMNELPEFIYQKKDGEDLRLNIVKLDSENGHEYRTLWTFADPVRDV